MEKKSKKYLDISYPLKRKELPLFINIEGKELEKITILFYVFYSLIFHLSTKTKEIGLWKKGMRKKE